MGVQRWKRGKAHCSGSQTSTQERSARSARESEVKAEAQSREVWGSLKENQKEHLTSRAGSLRGPCIAPLTSWLKGMQDADHIWAAQATAVPSPTGRTAEGQPAEGTSQSAGGLSVSVRSWAPTGQHRGQLQPPEQSRKGLLGGAAAAWASLRGHPGPAGPERPGRRPSGWRCQGHRCWFPSSRTHSRAAPASWPPPPAPPDLA